MKKEMRDLTAIQLLEENSLLEGYSDLRIFINNWMPQGNYDGQQEYFLNDLDRALNEIKELSKQKTKWVKIQDELPPVQKYIMVHHVTGGVITIYYSLMHKDTDLNGWLHKGISHWMDMPELPTNF